MVTRRFILQGVSSAQRACQCEATKRRLARLFKRGDAGLRPCHGEEEAFRNDPHWRDLLLFHEYFHADSGRGLGASHQTGWTALIALIMENLAAQRD